LLQITAVYPSAAIAGYDGHLRVLVSGRNFINTPDLSCRFGGTLVQADYIGPDTLACPVPHLPPSNVSLAVSINGEEFVLAGSNFAVVPEAMLLSAFPGAGPLEGGTLVTVTVAAGSLMRSTSHLACEWRTPGTGSVVVTGAATSPTIALDDLAALPSVLCMSPMASRQGEASITVSADGMPISQFPLSFLYYDAPRLTSILPSHGRLEGGTRLTVIGEGFDEDDTRCSFSYGTIATFTLATFVNSTALECPTPPVNVKIVASVSIDRAQGSLPYHYRPLPVISHVERRGRQVVISGSGFVQTSETLCMFGPILVPAVMLSPSELSCTAPLAPPGSVRLAVTDNGLEFVDAGQFVHIPEGLVISASPLAGPLGVGTAVQISGRGFSELDPPFCIFGGKSIKSRVLSAVAATCSAPVSNLPGTTTFVLNLHGVDVHNEDFIYYDPPVALAQYPSVGSVLTTVQIDGINMLYTGANSAFCLRNGKIVEARIISERRLECDIPCDEGEVSAAPIEVSLNGEDFSSGAGVFRCIAPAKVLSVSPLFGSAKGGTRVIVSGSGFNAQQDTWCEFGDAVPSRALYISLNSLACNSPPGRAGFSVPLVVRVGMGEGSPTQLTFHYIPEARVVSSALLTNAVVLYGGGFYDTHDLACFIGGLKTRAAFIDETSIRCALPSGITIGPVKLQVSNNGVDMEGDLDATLPAAPTIDVIVPDRGSVAGGTRVQILGSNFGYDATRKVLCRFGSLPYSEGVHLSKTSVECTAPASSRGPTTVSLSFDGGLSFISAVSAVYSYWDVPVINRIDPNSGPESGGTVITVSGSGFARAHSYQCILRDQNGGILRASDAAVVSESTLQCIAPAASPAARTFSVLVDDGMEVLLPATSPLLFFHEPTIVVLSVDPPSCPMQGGIPIVLRGSFGSSGPLWCEFGHTVTLGERVSSVLATCTSPPLSVPRAATVKLSVSTNGADFFLAHPDFTYSDFPIMEDLMPRAGSTSGGTTVTFTGQSFPNHGDMQCRFGDSVVFAYSVSSDTIVCHAPPVSKAGAVEVSLSLVAGEMFEYTGLSFFYFNPMELHSVSRRSTGSTGVDRSILSVSGYNFPDLPTLSCRFGLEISRALWIAPDLLQCEMSLDREFNQTLPLEITANGVDFVVLPNAFPDLRCTLTITRIEPALGSISGGNVVKLFGSGFDRSRCDASHLEQLACVFDSTVVIADLESDTHLSCIAPPHPPGPVSLSIGVLGSEILASVVYTYRDPPR
jgi:hypothetical protein